MKSSSMGSTQASTQGGGGSDEPPFFGQVAYTRYKLYPIARLQLTCFFMVQLKLATAPLSK